MTTSNDIYTNKCHCGHSTVFQDNDMQVPESMTYSLAVDYCNYCSMVRCDAYPGACER